MGGTIRVTSQLGHGTTFVLDLPGPFVDAAPPGARN
jgi:signal transduction histidine kinase